MATNIKIRFGIANPTKSKKRPSYTGTCYIDGVYHSSKDLGFDADDLDSQNLSYEALCYWGDQLSNKFNTNVKFTSKIELDEKFKKVGGQRGGYAKRTHKDNTFTLRNDKSLFRLLDDTIEKIGIMEVIEIMEVASAHVTSVHEKIAEDWLKKKTSDRLMARAMLKVFDDTGMDISDKIIDQDILQIYKDIREDPESHKDVGFKPNARGIEERLEMADIVDAEDHAK